MARTFAQKFLTLVGDAFGISSAYGDGWTETFESYPLNQFPTTNWTTFCGNSDMSITLDPINPNNKVFRLHGVVGGFWTSGANRAYQAPDDFTLSIRVWNGGESIPSSGHQVRADIILREGQCWQNCARGLIVFHKDGRILTGDWRTVLQTYETQRWYEVRIRHVRTATQLRMDYWIDGVFRGTVETTELNACHYTVNRVELTAAAGTVYYDDLVVRPTQCYADCDHSTGQGVLDIFDFLCFGNRFAAGDPYACNCDVTTGHGVCAIFDFLCFQNAWWRGCQ